MKTLDYLIVGQGLAGSFFTFELIKNNKSFIIFDENFNKASNVSAGIYNPVVLKRFVSIWNAKEQFNQLEKKIQEIQQFFNVKLLYSNQKVLRFFHDSEEYNIWKNKTENQDLDYFLDPDLKQDNIVNAPFGLGKVHKSGRVDIPLLIQIFRDYFIKNNQLKTDKFDYSQIIFHENKIEYQNNFYKKIVFCEGYQIKNNPFFNYIPILTDKGEYLKIKLDKKINNFLYKKKHFLFNYSNEYAYLGGTYDPKDISENISQEAKNILLDDINLMISFPYEILEQNWGFRPVSKDRRPILGKHIKYNNLFILNGLGTRGTFLGATFGKVLYDFIENNIELDKNIDSSRFNKLYPCK